jgi:hypothetical protein
MDRFRRKGGLALAAMAFVVVAALGMAACAEEDFAETHVVEGEPIELGDLQFNVQLTRFLNPNDREDAEYLQGQQVPPPLGKTYLGVFMEAENKGDDDVVLPSTLEMEVLDTTGATYDPLETESVFGFPFGETLHPDEEVPLPDTAAASGPIQGSVVIFLVSQAVSENRPLELELLADGAKGTIELDI